MAESPTSRAGWTAEDLRDQLEHNERAMRSMHEAIVAEAASVNKLRSQLDQALDALNEIREEIESIPVDLVLPNEQAVLSIARETLSHLRSTEEEAE